MCFWGFKRPNIKNKQPDAQNAQQRTQRLTLITIYPYIPTDAADTTCPPHMRKRRRGDKILVGTVVKAKVGEMEEDIREEF